MQNFIDYQRLRGVQMSVRLCAGYFGTVSSAPFFSKPQNLMLNNSKVSTATISATTQDGFNALQLLRRLTNIVELSPLVDDDNRAACLDAINTLSDNLRHCVGLSIEAQINEYIDNGTDTLTI